MYTNLIYLYILESIQFDVHFLYILINEIFSRNSIIYHKLTRTHKNRKYSIAVTSRYYTSLITLYYTCGMLMLLDLEM